MGVAWWNLQAQLYVAIQNDDLEKAGKVLESGVDCDARFLVGSQKRPAVCLCVEKGSLDLVKLLLSWGCSLSQTDAYGWNPLHIASAHGYSDLVALLLKNRVNPNAVNSDGRTALHLAAQTGSFSVVQLLLRAGAEVNQQDNISKTALMYACSNSGYEIVQLLLEHGADPNLQDTSGNSALHYATDAHLDYDVVNSLLSNRADVNLPNEDKLAVLHSVVLSPHSSKHSVLRALLRSGCDVNCTTSLGQTPVQLACLERDEVSAYDLILHGCDLNTCDKLGATPLYHAARYCSTNLVRLMVEAGQRCRLRGQPFLNNDVLLQALCPETICYLQEELGSFPSLQSLSRVSFRDHFGPFANDAVGVIKLPGQLKKFLMFQDVIT